LNCKLKVQLERPFAQKKGHIMLKLNTFGSTATARKSDWQENLIEEQCRYLRRKHALNHSVALGMASLVFGEQR